MTSTSAILECVIHATKVAQAIFNWKVLLVKIAKKVTKATFARKLAYENFQN